MKNFFDGGFNAGTEEKTETGDEYHKILNNVMALTRDEIKEIFGGPTEKEKFNGWLHYLADELHKGGEFRFITFCKDLDPACPLVALLWPPSPPKTPAEADKEAS